MTGADAGFVYVDHPADLAVRAWGRTTGEAFAEAARGLFAAMIDVERVAPAEAMRVRLSADSVELLLVDWLAALVAEKDLSGRVFSQFSVDVRLHVRGAELTASAWGESLDRVRHAPRLEVKGITRLGLSVREEEGRWVARYVADV